MAKYKHWFGLPSSGSKPLAWPGHSLIYIPWKQHRLLHRFRLCCWPLEANRPFGRPREQRVYRFCQNEVEDERHVLLKCPKYAQARTDAGLPLEWDMARVMNEFDQLRLSALLSEIWYARFVARFSADTV